MAASFSVGQRVVWQYKPAGGLGYEISVQATVTKIGKAKIQIEAPKQSDELVPRWVTPESVKPYQEVVSEPGPKHATRAKAEPNARQSLGLSEMLPELTLKYTINGTCPLLFP